MTTAQASSSRAPSDAAAVLSAYWTPRRIVWLIALLGIALRAWVIAGGWFYWDDYVFQARAWRLPLGADYLLYGHDGHFMPGAFLLQWPVTRAWPMNYLPLALMLVGAQAVVVVAFTRLSLAVWGPRWQAVLAVVVLAVTPMTLPTNTWWAAALNGLPLQLSLVTSLWCGLRWWRSGRRRSLVLAAVTWAVAITFSEKALIVPWAVLAAVPLLDGRQPARRLWRAVLSRTWPLWIAVVLVSIGYVGAYRTNVGKAPSNDGIASQVADLAGRALTAAVPSGVVGGPLRWQAVGYGAAIGEPPGWFTLLAVEALLLLLVVSCLRSRLARRAWLWVGAYLAVDLGLVVVGRLNAFVDPEVVQGLRYTSDAVVPLALTIPLALTACTPFARRLLSGQPIRRRRGIERLALPLLITVIVAMSVVSTASYRDIWRANDSRGYVATATASLAAAADSPSLVDQSVPASVLWGLDFPYNQASWLLSPISPRPDWGDPTTMLRQLDDSGRLRDALVDGPANVAGPVPGCGWLVHDGSDIPMQSRIIDWAFTVRLGYIASGDGSATLAIGDGTPRRIQVSKGLHEVVLTLTGGGNALRIRELTAGVTMCTDDVRIGHPVVVGS